MKHHNRHYFYILFSLLFFIILFYFLTNQLQKKELVKYVCPDGTMVTNNSFCHQSNESINEKIDLKEEDNSSKECETVSYITIEEVVEEVCDESPAYYTIRNKACEFNTDCNKEPHIMCQKPVSGVTRENAHRGIFYGPNGGYTCLDYHRVSYEVTNMENTGGEFSFELGILKSNERKISKGIKKRYVDSNASEIFEIEFCEMGKDSGCFSTPLEIPKIKKNCMKKKMMKPVTKYKQECL
ncbi:MAG: hypothetical protein Q7R76_02545 [Candidatus Woesearchaeota archaeon]|nr:hypothetical protein [Candidatus Woesearchaeota archaeon]